MFMLNTLNVERGNNMIAFNCPHCNAPIDTENLKEDERDNSLIKRCPQCLEFLQDIPK
jgi:NAD-dependent SIR2 family protein deacetylase